VAGEGGTEEVGRGETAEDVAEVVVVEDIDGRRHLGLRRRWWRNRGRRRWGFGFASEIWDWRGFWMECDLSNVWFRLCGAFWANFFRILKWWCGLMSTVSWFPYVLTTVKSSRNAPQNNLAASAKYYISKYKFFRKLFYFSKKLIFRNRSNAYMLIKVISSVDKRMSQL
jgi:hypothetical protein